MNDSLQLIRDLIKILMGREAAAASHWHSLTRRT